MCYFFTLWDIALTHQVLDAFMGLPLRIYCDDCSRPNPVWAPPDKKIAQQAQADLKDALDKAGYLSLAGKGPDDSDHKLGEFWFDKVYDGFFLKRSASAIPEAERR